MTTIKNPNPKFVQVGNQYLSVGLNADEYIRLINDLKNKETAIHLAIESLEEFYKSFFKKE